MHRPLLLCNGSPVTNPLTVSVHTAFLRGTLTSANYTQLETDYVRLPITHSIFMVYCCPAHHVGFMACCCPAL
eukprot:366162-Chlamydomonas_euryale.AAC.7